MDRQCSECESRQEPLTPVYVEPDVGCGADTALVCQPCLERCLADGVLERGDIVAAAVRSMQGAGR